MKNQSSRHIGSLIVLLFFLSTIMYVELNLHTIQGATTKEPPIIGYKQVTPLFINKSAIPIGSSERFSYQLNKSLNYHIYMSGDWIENVTVRNNVEYRTDYDIYIYNPYSRWIPETYHTEASGLPEHLGTTPKDPLFTPKYTGLYEIEIKNDRKESDGAQSATLMVIEHLETNKWYRNKLYLTGKDGRGQSWYFTTWAYEFNTNEPNFTIIVKVPDSLDIYEARVYLMADPSQGVGDVLTGLPIPRLSFLYGDRDTTGNYGGYNLNSTGYRGNEFASFEDYGLDRRFTFDSGSDDEKLYHLVFIGEKGKGRVSFIIKTDFTPPNATLLNPFNETKAYEETLIEISMTDDDSDIARVIGNYTTNDRRRANDFILTQTEKRTYVARIPGQPPGTIVSWNIEVRDNAWNIDQMNGSYRNIGQTSISFTPSPLVSTGDETITITGQITPPNSDEELILLYTSGANNIERTVTTNGIGEFVDEFTPVASGIWQVQANWIAGENFFNSINSTSFEVKKIPTQLTINIDEKKVKEGNNINIWGNLTPKPEGTSILLTYTDPSGDISAKQIMTNERGDFSTSFKPNKPGSWWVKTSWEGNTFYDTVESNTLTITVSAKYSRNTLIIGAGALVAIIAVIAIIYFKRRKGATKTGEEDDLYI